MQLPRRARTDRQILTATLAAAVCVPVAARAYLGHRIHGGLAPALGALCGQPVSIDDVEAGLTGSVRMTGVAIGDVFAADAIEASVSLDNLLAGQLGADEIRIERPRVNAQVDAAGDSDLARLVRHLAHARGAAAAGAEARRRVHRVVVSDGALVVDVGGHARVIAEDVELVPEPGGVRVVTGSVTASGGAGPFSFDARFARGAADVSLSDASIPRLLATGGVLSVSAGGAPLALSGATFARGVYGGAVTLAARALDDGVPRPITIAARAGAAGRAVRVEATGVPLAMVAPLAPRGVVLGGAHATGAITIARAAATGAVRVVGDVAVDGAVLDSRAVTAGPVPVAGRLALAATIAGAVIDVDDATLAVGAIAAHARGRVTRGGLAGVRAGDVDVKVDPAPCLAELESLPAAIRGPLDGMVLDGTAGAHGHVRWDLDAAPGEAVELALDLDTDACRVVAEAPAADPNKLRGAAEHTFPDGTRAVVGPGVGDWVALGDLPAHVDGAFRAAEDEKFFEHRGFDPAAIAKSFEVDLREGRFARGGSTISQQLVKNEWLTMRRTLDRKVQEAILTWRLESVLPKRVILERYLNEIELGPGVFGVGAAARWWFGEPAKELSVREAAFLAAMTAEPRSMTARIVAAGGVDRETEGRIDTVLRQMRRAGVIDRDEMDRAIDDRVTLRREALKR